MWQHRGGRMRIMLKTDESMRQATLDPAILVLPFFIVLCSRGVLVFTILLGSINRILKDGVPQHFPNFHFLVRE
jgi:hypothetical protein